MHERIWFCHHRQYMPVLCVNRAVVCQHLLMKKECNTDNTTEVNENGILSNNILLLI